jgi:hypothetical protein
MTFVSLFKVSVNHDEYNLMFIVVFLVEVHWYIPKAIFLFVEVAGHCLGTLFPDSQKTGVCASVRESSGF